MEIRRIRPEEAEAVVQLWDTLARETPDGGALTERGKANLKRMLAAAASHPRQQCLVALEGDEVIGFLVFKLSGDELLPGVAGELEEHFVLACHRRRGIGRRLVESAVATLRAQGAWTITAQAAVDEPLRHAFWRDLGFEQDVLRFSIYGEALVIAGEEDQSA